MKLPSLVLILLCTYINSSQIGVDVSAWQDAIDWPTVATTEVEFAMLRASVNRKVDVFFEANYYGALEAGVNVAGIYYYTYSMSEADCAGDADFVISNLGGKKVPVYFDVEEQDQADLGPQTVTNMMMAFIKRCQSYGYECNVYTNLNWYRNIFYPDQLRAVGVKFWVASWGPDDGYLHEEYKPNVGEICWQYTSNGYINGIGPVDMDVLYEDVPTPDPGPTPTPTGDEKMVKIVVDVINRRSSPAMDPSNIIGSYVYGDKVQVKGISDDKQWYLDAEGYYFTTEPQYVVDLIAVCTADIGLNIRSEPSTSASIVGVIAYGASVAVIRQSGEWYYIQTVDGTKGYANGSYLSM